MTVETETTVEEKIVRILRRLGIERAHFASRGLNDWHGMAERYPESIASLSLVCPLGFDSQVLSPLSDRLLVINADEGISSETIARNLQSLSSAAQVTLTDCTFPNNYDDLASQRGGDVAPAILDFLKQMDVHNAPDAVSSSEQEGEEDGIYFKVQGSGPPLVLLPLGAAPSQWEPVIDSFSQRYCVISMSGPALGMVASLESRGHTAGYLSAVGSLLDAAEIQPGDRVLEVGCGTGVLCRWLARRLEFKNTVVGIDVNAFFLREAAEIARREGLQERGQLSRRQRRDSSIRRRQLRCRLLQYRHSTSQRRPDASRAGQGREARRPGGGARPRPRYEPLGEPGLEPLPQSPASSRRRGSRTAAIPWDATTPPSTSGSPC